MTDIETLKLKVKSAVDIFIENDIELLELASHEQAISHRIAVYLESMFTDLNVDCEYNKHLKCSKKINLSDFIKLTFNDNSLRGNKCTCKRCTKIIRNLHVRNPLVESILGEFNEKKFRPDILIHRRNSEECNKIAIEIKVKGVCLFDISKLKALTNRQRDNTYGYTLGVFIYFEENKPKLLFFYDSKNIN